MDSLSKDFKIIFPFHPNQKSDQLYNIDSIQNGIIAPRPIILEFEGTIKDLKEKLSKYTGFSIEGIKIHNEKEEILINVKNSQILEQILEKEQEILNIYKISVLIQFYGQIAIPIKNLQSMFKSKL